MSQYPYPGLRPFYRDETDIFFGRESHSDELLEKLGKTHFLAVIGPSGYGKSSLARTGLLPGLEAGLLSSAGSYWRIADMRPGDQPFARLVAALLEEGALGRDYLREADDDAYACQLRAGVLEKNLRETPYGLHLAWEDTRGKAGLQGHKLLILVDQFEELFRYSRQASLNDTVGFVALLLAASQHPDMYIAITMRSDFIGECSMFHGLPAAINQGLYLLPRLTRDQLADAIALPARVFGGSVEPALINRLLNDAGNDPDQLPLLQHALMRMWRRAIQEQEPAPEAAAKIVLDLRHYEAVGSFSGALSSHAERIYQENLAPGQRPIAEHVFRSLTAQEGGRIVRRPVKLGTVADLAGVDPPQVIEVVEIFRTPGRNFLTPPVEVELSADSMLDLSHESLIRQWQRLSRWTEAEAQAAALYRRMEDSALRWHNGQAALWRSPELETGLLWREQYKPTATWASRYGTQFDLAMSFLDLSRREQEKEQRQKERARRSRMRQLTLFLVFLVILEVLAAWKWWEAEQQRKVAEQQTLLAQRSKQEAFAQKSAAEQQTDKALRTQSLFLADLARQQLQLKRPFSAMRLALEALPGSSEANPKRPLAWEAQQRLYEALESHYRGLLEHSETISCGLFSPDGNYLLSCSGKQALLWPVSYQEQPRALEGHQDRVIAAAFSPDSKLAATASRDGTARLWEVESGKMLALLEGHAEWVNSVAFSPDGTLLASAARDNTARIWQVSGAALLHTLQGHESYVYMVAFSPDGKTLASASRDATARLWEVETGAAVAVLQGHQDGLNSVAFSPDGLKLVTASGDKTARVWEAASGKLLGVLEGHKYNVHSAVFSPDSKRIVTSSSDKTAQLWDAETLASIAVLRGHAEAVFSAAFSPDGQAIATASSDKTMRLWDGLSGSPLSQSQLHDDWVLSAFFDPTGTWLASISSNEFRAGNTALSHSTASHAVYLWGASSAKPRGVLKGPENRVNSLAFSPDGSKLALAAGDILDQQNRIQLWNPATGGMIKAMSGHTGTINSIAFSPDGRKIVTAAADVFGHDNTARIWDSETGEALRILQGHGGNVNSAVFSPNGKRVLTASSDKTAWLWDAETGNPLQTLHGHDGTVAHATFSPDGRWVVTAASDHLARIWDSKTGAIAQTLSGHEDALRSAIFSPDGSLIATASADQTARLWDAASGKLLSVLRGHEGIVHAAAFSPDGHSLLTVSADKTGRLWDTASGKLLTVLKGHVEPIYAVAFSPDGKLAATASLDGSARLWPIFSSLESMVSYAYKVLPRSQMTCQERLQFFLEDVPRCVK